MMTLKHTTEMHPTAGREAEPPPPPPGVMGNVTLRMGDTYGTTSEESLSQVLAGGFWPAGSTSGRQVALVQLTNSDEFAAFGVFTVTNPLVHCCKVPFVAWGKVSADLNGFLDKMEVSGAEVDWLDTEDLLKDMPECVALIEEMSVQQKLLAAMDWKQEPSNKDTVTRTAA